MTISKRKLFGGLGAALCAPVLPALPAAGYTGVLRPARKVARAFGSDCACRDVLGPFTPEMGKRIEEIGRRIQREGFDYEALRRS